MEDADEVYEELEEEAAPAEPFSATRVASDWLNAIGGFCELAAEFPYSIARGLAGHARHNDQKREFAEQAGLEIERLTRG